MRSHVPQDERLALVCEIIRRPNDLPPEVTVGASWRAAETAARTVA